jgi:hypothetical protein
MPWCDRGHWSPSAFRASPCEACELERRELEEERKWRVRFAIVWGLLLLGTAVLLVRWLLLSEVSS